MGYLMGQAGQYWTRGRRPTGNCVTFELTEANVQQRRALFRKWKELVIKNYQSLSESLDHEYIEVLEAIKEVRVKSVVRKKKDEQGMTQKEKLI